MVLALNGCKVRVILFLGVIVISTLIGLSARGENSKIYIVLRVYFLRDTPTPYNFKWNQSLRAVQVEIVWWGR